MKKKEIYCPSFRWKHLPSRNSGRWPNQKVETFKKIKRDKIGNKILL
jgi:hypothetical protein